MRVYMRECTCQHVNTHDTNSTPTPNQPLIFPPTHHTSTIHPPPLHTHPHTRRYGSYLRRFIAATLFVLCFIELGLLGGVFILGKLYYCEHTDISTQCTVSESTPHMLVLMTIWPGTLFFSTLGGLLTYLAKVKSKWVRMYAAYARLAVIPNFVIVWYYFEFLLPVIEYAGEH